MLAKKPEDRFASTSEVQAALASLPDGLTDQTPTVDMRPRTAE